MSGTSLGRVTTQLLLGRVLGYVLGLGNSIIVARVLGVDRLGAYAYAMGIAALFGLLPNMGFSTVVTRAVARDPEAGACVARRAIRAQAAVAGGVVLVIPAFAALLPEQPVALTWVALAAIQLAIGTLSWPYLAVLGGHARYDRVAACELLSAIAGTGSLLVAAALRGGVAAFIWAHVAAATAAVIVARVGAEPFLPRATEAPGLMSSLFRESAPFAVTGAVQSLYMRVDILLLGQIASPFAVGLYSAAYKPVNLMVFLGATGAGTLFPVLAQWSGTGPLRPFERALRALVVVAPAVALALSGLSEPLLGSLYGRDFAAGAPVLMVLAWSSVANWFYSPFGVGLQARGKERWWMASVAGGLVLNTAGNLWAIPRWGALGAAYATLASEAALLVAGWTLGRWGLGLGFSLRSVAGVLVAAGIGGSALLLLWPAGPMVATLGAIFAYVGVLVPLRIVRVQDVVTVIEWVRQSTLGWSRG